MNKLIIFPFILFIQNSTYAAEWENYEPMKATEPRSSEEVVSLKREIEAREKVIEAAREAQEREMDVAKKEKAELLVRDYERSKALERLSENKLIIKGAYVPPGVDIEVARVRAEVDLPEAQKQFTSAEAQLSKISESLGTQMQPVSSGAVTKPAGPQTFNVNDYKLSLQERIEVLPTAQEQVSALRKEFFASKEDLDFKRQASVVQTIAQEVYNLKLSPSDPEYANAEKLANAALDRGRELFNFKPSDPIPANKIDQELSLYNKIPSDRTVALKAKIINFNEKYPNLEDQYNALNQLKEIIEVYKIDDKNFIKQVNDKFDEIEAQTVPLRANKAASLSDKLDVLNADLYKSYAKAGYKSELKLLESLTNTARSISSTDVDVQNFNQIVQNRIKEINAFIQNPPAVPAHLTEFEKKLDLANSIPSDRMRDIKQEFAKALSSKDIATLQEIKTALKDFNLSTYDPNFEPVLDNMVATFKAEQQAKIPQESGIVTTAVQSAEALKNAVISGGTVIANKSAELASPVLDNLNAWADRMLVKEGQMLESVSESAQRWGQNLEKAPELLNSTLQMIHDFENSTAVKLYLKANAGFISLTVGPEYAEQFKSLGFEAKEKLKSFLESQQAKQFAQWAAQGGKGLRGVSELAAEAQQKLMQQRDQLKGASVDKLKVERDRIQSIQDFIDAHRGQIDFTPPSQSPIFEEIKSSVLKYIKKVGEWFQGTFKTTIQDRFTTVSARYTDQQNTFKKFLGVPENASKDQIENAIKNKAQDPALNEQVQALAQATADMASIYKDFVDKLQGAQSNFAFVVSSWDGLDINAQKASTADLVEGIMALRNLKLNELAAAKLAIDQLQKDVGITAGTSFEQVGKSFIDSLYTIINKNTAKTISDFNNVMTQINNSLESQRLAMEQSLSSAKPQKPSADGAGGL